MAITVADCRKAATVVRTMLQRIQAQLGTSLDGSSLLVDSIPTESTSTSDEQISSMADMTLRNVWTNHSSDGYNGIDNNSEMGLSARDFTNFGMVGPNLGPIGGHSDTSVQQPMNMADPWGVPQMQSGYDWVSHPFPISNPSRVSNPVYLIFRQAIFTARSVLTN